LWRLILEGVATKAELQSSWTLDDVWRANALLDMRHHEEAAAIKRAQGGRGGHGS
jgi:hypothetical protein